MMMMIIITIMMIMISQILNNNTTNVVCGRGLEAAACLLRRWRGSWMTTESTRRPRRRPTRAHAFVGLAV